MFPAMSLGRLFGIPVRVHSLFWILPLLVVVERWGDPSLGFHLILLFAIFGCVILHELGHAVAARLYGIRTRDITIYPIGGIASLERISDKPAEEFVIAIAGPLVNVLIAAVLFVATMAAVTLAPSAFPGTVLFEFLRILCIANLVLCGFNLIPAFPLDGGRIFRALLGFFMSHLQATRVAVYVGIPLTILLMVLVVAIWHLYNPFLFFIAFFVIMAGRQELAMLEYRERMRRMASPFESPTVVARDLPAWMQPAVTVYVWDPANGVWVRQEQRV